MSRNRVPSIHILAFFVLSILIFVAALLVVAPAGAGQVAQPPEKTEPHQHQHGHQMNTPSGASDKCEPTFTYEDGPRGPSHWEGVCNTGHMQSPIDITKAEQVPIPPLPPLEFKYQPAELDMVND